MKTDVTLQHYGVVTGSYSFRIRLSHTETDNGSDNDRRPIRFTDSAEIYLERTEKGKMVYHLSNIMESGSVLVSFGKLLSVLPAIVFLVNNDIGTELKQEAIDLIASRFPGGMSIVNEMSEMISNRRELQ